MKYLNKLKYIYKWKWMVLGALGCINNVGLVNIYIYIYIYIYILQD